MTKNMYIAYKQWFKTAISHMGVMGGLRPGGAVIWHANDQVPGKALWGKHSTTGTPSHIKSFDGHPTDITSVGAPGTEPLKGRQMFRYPGTQPLWRLRPVIWTGPGNRLAVYTWLAFEQIAQSQLILTVCSPIFYQLQFPGHLQRFPHIQHIAIIWMGSYQRVGHCGWSISIQI